MTPSKLALNINGKLNPAGGHSTVRYWLNNLTMTVPEFPSGGLLPGIGNDQVLIKKWTVRKDNRAQISVLTSLPPRNWSKHVKVAEENPEQRRKIIEACSPSETDENVIHHEVRYKKKNTEENKKLSQYKKYISP